MIVVAIAMTKNTIAGMILADPLYHKYNDNIEAIKEAAANAEETPNGNPSKKNTTNKKVSKTLTFNPAVM